MLRVNADDRVGMSDPIANQTETPAGDAEAAAGSDTTAVSDERRVGDDRRSMLDRRRGPGRRRTDYRRDAEEGHMNEEQLEFLKAMDEYKRVNSRPFPTWTEVLDVVLFLGYRKVAPMGEFKMTKGRQNPPKGE